MFKLWEVMSFCAVRASVRIHINCIIGKNITTTHKTVLLLCFFFLFKKHHTYRITKHTSIHFEDLWCKRTADLPIISATDDGVRNRKTGNLFHAGMVNRLEVITAYSKIEIRSLVLCELRRFRKLKNWEYSILQLLLCPSKNIGPKRGLSLSEHVIWNLKSH